MGNIEEVFDKVESELNYYYDIDEGEDYPFYLGYIPKGLSRIPTISFSHGGCDCNDELESIVIPDTITTISDMAFQNCSSLTSVVIPASVTSIATDVFVGCGSLTSIAVDENNKNYKSVDGNLYSKDGKTLIQYAIGKKNEEFVIPAGVTSICENAFGDCESLASVVIPDSVTSVGHWAFDGCENFERVFYGGTEDDFANIEIDEENGYLEETPKYFYSEEQPTEEGNYWHYVDGVPTVW